MKTIFLKECKRTRRSLFLWSLIIGILAVFGMLEYPIISGYINTLMPILQSIPKLVQIMFGVYQVDLTTPIGYYICMYFWCGLIVFTHSVYIGATIIAKDERDKTSEYIFSKPYKRDSVVMAKVLAAAVNALVVAVVTGSVSALAMIPINMSSVIYLKVAAATLGMFLTQLVMVALGLLCSALFKKYKFGLLAAIGVLVASYTVAVIIEYAGNINYLNFLSPLCYFNVQYVVNNGISLPYLAIAAAVIVVSLYFTFSIYRKRDLPI